LNGLTVVRVKNAIDEDVQMTGFGVPIMKGFALALVSALMLANAAFAEDSKNCDLSIEILGLDSDKGKLMVALIDNAEAFEEDAEPTRDERIPIEQGRGHTMFSAVPYGSYAVKIFHDENSNKELDTNFVGYPKESFGFSNDAMGKIGPPSFEAASFDVATPTLSITINMK
jgi:uncharacterized protein (DUF2141 family)